MPLAITKDNFDQEVTKSSKPVIVDVYATWCGPCQMMEPVIAELEKELSATHKFVKINVDESRDLAVQFGVTSIPTFVFMKDGKVKGKETGYLSKEDLKAKVTEHLS
ncbi:MAG: thioredoxin [Candidatus Babeliales bacterium]